VDEKLKYETAWNSGDERNSRTALPFAQSIEAQYAGYKGLMLDLGCGNGLVVSYLRSKGFNVIGADITLAGLGAEYKDYHNGPLPLERASRDYFIEAPLWNLPFPNSAFDLTFSCDVLEHIPPDRVDDVLKEIIRVTKAETHHIIATFADRDFHPTVQPISWWSDRFEKAIGVNGTLCFLRSRKEFLAGIGYTENLGL